MFSQKAGPETALNALKFREHSHWLLSSGWLWFIEGYPDSFFLILSPHFLKFSHVLHLTLVPPKSCQGRTAGVDLLISKTGRKTHGKSSNWLKVKLFRGGHTEVVTCMERELRKLWSAAGHVAGPHEARCGSGASPHPGARLHIP